MNGINAPTKRHTLAEWMQKQDPYIYCLQETEFRPRDSCTTNVKGTSLSGKHKRRKGPTKTNPPKLRKWS